ncbi:Gamma-secretase subunit PEN-2 [Aphelenchoides besseyi]|nr:Gamma-secretase subunit PEN-2 [Aphelenchoides besseyi]
MVNLEKLSTQERCDLCRKYFLIGLACAPFVWIVNCLWFYDYAFRSKNTDVVEQAEIKPMKKYVIMSSVGIAFWIVLLGIWLYMYTIARDARVPWAEYITFIVPVGRV